MYRNGSYDRLCIDVLERKNVEGQVKRAETRNVAARILSVSPSFAKYYSLDILAKVGNGQLAFQLLYLSHTCECRIIVLFLGGRERNMITLADRDTATKVSGKGWEEDLLFCGDVLFFRLSLRF
uniref:Uncharacterized protein n=1 Tax=Palpitomonas bilix TaxID=652834 RepID=A0A7S3GC32_9EUKA|mmetsp:Transcript_4269/g.8514  ORF Transcript_4269/g.8514 Transcript_4269/m.8514 type:complete len:124 (+) Transcript_4269:374-745(+)